MTITTKSEETVTLTRAPSYRELAERYIRGLAPEGALEMRFRGVPVREFDRDDLVRLVAYFAEKADILGRAH